MLNNFISRFFRYTTSFAIVWFLTQPRSLSIACENTFDPALFSNPYSKGVVFIVDAYSSGRFLAKEFRKHGYFVIHVQSGKEVPEGFQGTFIRSDFDANLVWSNQSLEEITRQITSLRPAAVVPGTETGVILANKVSYHARERLELPYNIPLTEFAPEYELFRDKWAQHETLAKAGIRHARQIATEKPKEIMKWIRKNQLFKTGSKAVVIKPRAGAGTEGVFVCRNKKDVYAAVASLLEGESHYGFSLERIVAQEFLEGTEYVVNTVSRDGRLVVTDIWKYKKRIRSDGKGVIYDYDELLGPKGEVQDQLVPYTKEVLNALQYRNGWAHTEIFLTENGPVLVEVNARMMGAGQPVVTGRALGESQIEVGVESLFQKEKFFRRSDLYQLKNHAFVISLSAEKEGGVINEAIIDELKDLPGYSNHSFNYSGEKTIKRTEDLSTALGQVELIGPDRNELMKTLETIRLWEKQGRFQRR